ncbi:MAG: intradiol ring-cleavage dioxygenase [Bacteroidetes bacterium]|nr:intradiol ring-cleavage dioxygenase [Bacteroidota bacterium]
MRNFIFWLFTTTQLMGQTNSKVGGGCDGCEIMYHGMPKQINAVDTSAGWFEAGTKLIVKGLVLQRDGRTPAANVVVYYWHTDNNGRYSPAKGAHNATRHGHLRGWVKTGRDGRYEIYTIRPAAYPSHDEPQHIHLSIKESELANEYYVDDLVFDDDPLLYRKTKRGFKAENRGGSGVLRIGMKKNIQVAVHDIVLGLNIPNYPSATGKEQSSGLEIGEDSPSFGPTHAWGPDKGTEACPVCKYGRYHGILYFVGNRPNWSEIKKWLSFLETESQMRGKYLKVYFVYGNEKGFDGESLQRELAAIGKELAIRQVALTFVPSLRDTISEVHLNKVDPVNENTFVIYRNRTIVDKRVNLSPNDANFQLIRSILDNTKTELFSLPSLSH